MASPFVLDASLAVSWCFPGDATENTPYSRHILEELAFNDAVVPEIWPFEIANAIFVAYSKRKRIDEHQVNEYLNLLKAFPIHVRTQTIWQNIALESVARRYGIAAYDAAYLDLALRLRLPLAAFDGLLRETAVAAGVALLP